MHYTQSGYTLCSYLAIPKLSFLQFIVHACLFLCLLHISYIVPTEITTYNLNHWLSNYLKDSLVIADELKLNNNNFITTGLLLISFGYL